MPTYEYVCRNCGHGFEVVQSMRDEPLTICDECGGELRKVFTAPAISFKGSGFYATDHGKRKVEEPAEKTGEKKDDKAAASKSSDSKSSESKPSESKQSESKPSESTPSGSGASAKKETSST
ncbi:MAG TPA: FmdB family zinc ribbon protein [Actinomycetota bacterium]|jgi:putative FmdB family regulatory protein|nr:FmdB family zinc ribbon protein [Actinomycetota bacterium]